MAKNKKILKKVTNNGNQPISLKIEVRKADRSFKDIRNYLSALDNASRVHNPNRSTLYDIYTTIMDDPFLAGLIEKRFDAVLNRDMYFRKNDKRFEPMDERCNSEVFREECRELMLKRFWGLTGLQYMVGKNVDIYKIPRKHIKPDLGIISFEQSGNEGFDYTSDPFIWVVGDENDYGLLLKCAALVLLKRANWADWAQFNEIFGMPVRVLTYNMHDPQSKIEARKALQETGGALELLLPEGVNYDMKDGKNQSSNGELFNNFRKAINEELSVLVLGNTETTTSSKSTGYAQSKTHALQQFEVTKSDMVYLLNKLNSPKYFEILKSYGFDVEGGQFEFEREIDMQAVKEQMVVISMVKKGGTPVSDDYIYDVTGIPKPDNYDELKTQQEEERLARQQQMQQKQEQDDKENKSPGTKAALKNWLRFFP